MGRTTPEENDNCEYEFTLSGQRDGQPVTSIHTIMFVKDDLGRWKIMQF